MEETRWFVNSVDTCITHTVNNIVFWDDNMKNGYTSENSTCTDSHSQWL